MTGQMSTFEKLIEIRKAKLITQKEMAQHLECTASSLNKYESGKRNISAEMQDKYALYLKIGIAFVEDKGNNNLEISY